jgi:hypothetical protein
MKLSNPSPPIWMQRVGWMLLIWAAGVTTLTIVALSIRMLMKLADLTT